AARAAARGAQVTLVAGPVSLATPPAVERHDVRSASEMRASIWAALGKDLSRADALVMAAAVADYRPVEASTSKIKKRDSHLTLQLAKNPDLLAEVGAARTGRRPVLVGFALETAGQEALVSYARGKLTEKRVDLVVANAASESFERDDDRATFVTAAGAEPHPVMSKADLADVLLDRVRDLIRPESQ